MNGATGVDAVRAQLKDADRTTAHAVAAPAEDDGVDAPRQDPLQQYLAFPLMHEPAKKEVHRAGRSYHVNGDKAKESGKEVVKWAGWGPGTTYF